MKRFNPYTALLDRAQKFRSQVINPVTKIMWNYPKADLKIGWPLTDLYERVAAADTIGYDVKLIAAERGLEVFYVKRPKDDCF
jgi:hypothetical protein